MKKLAALVLSAALLVGSAAALSPEEEKALRRRLVETALRALTTEVEDQTIFAD